MVTVAICTGLALADPAMAATSWLMPTEALGLPRGFLSDIEMVAWFAWLLGEPGLELPLDGYPVGVV